MYTPRTFRVDDSSQLAVFMRRYSFCTLITPGDDGLAISHVPVLVEDDGGKITLLGHLARVNPHLEVMDGRCSTAVFHGPHSYVSPAWYAETGEVPTWNYAVVHATGKTRTFSTPAKLSELVDRMVDTYESKYGEPWDRRLPEDYRTRQLDYITGFEIAVEKVVGKYKLGQNRSQADQDSMLDRLADSSDEDSRGLAEFVKRYRRQNQPE